jgi:hypothetical protein
VVHPNLGLLARWWENPWGKLFYAFAASVTVTVGKIWADQVIRFLTQSNPAIFPNAQQAITVCLVFSLVFVEIAIAMFVPVYWMQLKWIVGLLPFMKQTKAMSAEAIRMIACIYGSMLLFYVGFFLVAGFSTFNTMERLLLWSSFVPNDRGLAGSDLICTNLPSDSLVFPFSTRDPIPHQVVIAQPISTGPDRLGLSYAYYVIPCLKPPSIRSSFP